MTRLRFKKDGPYLTSPTMVVGERFAHVVIDPVLLIYHILDTTNDMPLFSGQCNTLAQCKKEAKGTLKVLGCNFNDEIRKQTKLELE